MGDLAAGAISLAILHKAWRLGAPRRLILQMAGNVALDVAIGSIPVAGTAFDVFFKANNVNVRLLREHLAGQGKRLPLPLPEQRSAAERE